jgi:hypothetical protein
MDEPVPPDVIEAARRVFRTGGDVGEMLAVAAPYFRAQERERIRQLAIKHEAEAFDPPETGAVVPFADLLGGDGGEKPS